MKITVLVRAGAKEQRVEKLATGEWRVLVKAPPVDGKANAAVIAALAKELNVTKRQVRLVTGASSKKKIFEIG